MGQVRDVMTGNPTTCEPTTTLVDAAKVIAKEDVGSVPIVESGRLVGIVTDRDIVIRAVAEGRDVASTTVKDVASKDPVTVTPDDDLDRALQLMGQRQVRRIPVVDGDRVVGIVSQADVARAADDRKTGDVVQQISE